MRVFPRTGPRGMSFLTYSKARSRMSDVAHALMDLIIASLTETVLSLDPVMLSCK